MLKSRVKSRWVYRVKDDDLYKARFCAKGFTQRWGEDYDETFAPVAKYTSIRTLMALLAGRQNVEIHQMDVNTAFLCSDIDEVVYVEQPEGFEIDEKEDWVCLLNKALYGLKQSSRAWFQCIAPILIGFDFLQCELDPCIFVHTNLNGEKTYIAPVMGFGRSEPEADRWLDRYFELIGRARLPLALPG